jgi:methylmalonyl-CoA mutase N-terminal domain/subunit
MHKAIKDLQLNGAKYMAQRQRLAALRQRRDNARVSELLDQLEQAAQGDENLMPLLVTCVEHHATLGEICGRLRQVWGEYQPANWI